MGTEDWVLKGTKLLTNTKNERLKIQSRGWIFKNTILKKKKSQKLLKKYEVCFKKYGLFFFFAKLQVIKMKIKGVIEYLK